jgi:hypothetical protein
MKSDAKTIRKRVEEIASLKLLGALWADIRQHAEQQDWKVSDRQLHRYLAAAEEVIAANVEKNRDKLMAHHFAARRALYARAMAVSDYRTALGVLRDEAELLAMYPPRRTQLSGQGGGPLVLNIVEEIVGRPTVPALNVVEEVVTNGTHSGTTACPGPDDPLASRAASLPPQ